jgi:predicted ATPase
MNDPLRERRGRLIQIKFDKENNQPMSSVFRALDQYCQDLQGDLDLLHEVGDAVKTALGSFSQILLSQMPNLFALVGEISTSLPSLDNKEKYHMLLSCLQSFVRVISAPSHPTVILFDDLQWADNETLDLMSKLVMDKETRSCLFVGCYRDNEVLTDHPLLEYLGQIALSGVPMWQIFQASIDRGSINKLLSDSLHLLPRITAPLAREMHKKSGGNPHFVKQLLQSLCDERLLQYSPSARRWQWDISAIRSKNVPDNAVALLLERMTQYGPDVQRVLQVAALMGRRFGASALKMFQAGGDGGGDGSAILAHIDTVVDDGLACVDKAELRFAHDSIWEAAISLTPALERESMHLQIGRQILHAVSNRSCESLDVHLQLIVDQLNYGSSLIESYDEKLRLTELNRQVGQQSLAACSFLEATLYLLQGCALLSEVDWGTNYRLCLEIFTACAEAQLAYGNNDGAIISANAVILHGASLNDKLRAHFTVYTALFVEGKLEDAAQEAWCVLGELGICLPSLETNVEPEIVKSEVEKTERLILPLDSENVATMTRPILEDDGNALTITMKFLFSVVQMLYVKNPGMMALVCCRMVQMITEKGMTSEASFAFATYSMLLCELGLRDRAAVCAQRALVLLDKFCGTYSHIVLLALGVSIWPYRQPWRACLESFEQASRDATAVGDVSIVLTCLTQVFPLHIFVPVSTLQQAISKLNEYRRTVKSSGHPNFLSPIIHQQLALNLTTSFTVGPHANDDPTILRGIATNQADILSLVPQSNMYYVRLVRKVDFARLFLGYLFRRHDVMLEMASNVKDHLMSSERSMYPAIELLLEKFYLGLAAYSIVRRGGSDRTESWKATADELTNEMKALSENDSEWNFQQKYFLLEAEKAFTDGKLEPATFFYDKAIEAAKQHRFVNEQALASECAAVFYLDHGNVGQARMYFVQARQLYKEWGAHRKVDDVDSLLATM